MLKIPTNWQRELRVVDPEPVLAARPLARSLEGEHEPAWANASVTIANAIPPTRRLTAPVTSGSTSPTNAVKRIDGQNPQCHLVIAIPATYTPTAK